MISVLGTSVPEVVNRFGITNLRVLDWISRGNTGPGSCEMLSLLCCSIVLFAVSRWMDDLDPGMDEAG
jgi:hypothetical protein